MKDKSSTLYILFILLGISVAIVGMFIGCNDNKQVNPPILGPAAGAGPVGGGETQAVTILNESATLYITKGEASSIDIVALVENNIGQPMPDGTAVYWTVEDGDSSATTTSNGSSTYTWEIDKDFDGCTDIMARSGDASDTVRFCVVRIKGTPTATPTPSATATPGQTLSMTAVDEGPTDTTLTVSNAADDEAIIQACTSNNASGVTITFSTTLPTGLTGNFTSPTVGATTSAITNATGCTAAGGVVWLATASPGVGTAMTITATATGYTSVNRTMTVDP